MPNKDKEPEGKPMINEEFFAEWLKYGFAELQIYMLKYAQFEQWCIRHPQPEESDGSPSSSQG